MLIYTLDALSEGIEGYPFELLYVLTYTISLTGVVMELSATNLGEINAPYFVGWHSYFALGADHPDELELEIPAMQGVVMDDSLVPLPGESAYVERAKGSELDFSVLRSIGETRIDDYFVSLNAPVARLTNRAKGVSLEVQGERGCMISFTSDSLEDAPRSAIALEPMEMIANAYNREEYKQSLILAPGETRSYEASFTLHKI
jgi:aldose 1-epimerase